MVIGKACGDAFELRPRRLQLIKFVLNLDQLVSIERMVRGS